MLKHFHAKRVQVYNNHKHRKRQRHQEAIIHVTNGSINGENYQNFGFTKKNHSNQMAYLLFELQR